MIVRREIGEIVRYLRHRKISAASQTVATARIAPKVCQASPQHTVPDFIRLVHLQQSYSRTREDRSFAPWCISMIRLEANNDVVFLLLCNVECMLCTCW